MKKILVVLFSLLLVVGCTKKDEKLPTPEVTDGFRGELGIDKNVNEETIDKYLFRDDSVYMDMRDLVDEADYSAIDGDSYLSGTIKGFEVVPFPKLVNVTGLPEAVGKTYEGKTLFTHTEDDEYIPNYKESMDYLNYYFPKDKYIFLLCGGGGYAGMMKKMLVNLGWNTNKIYVVGGYWFYNGDNKLEIKRVINGKDHYDFWKLTYHDINLDYFNEV